MKNILYLLGITAVAYGVYTWYQKKSALVSQVSVGIDNAIIKLGFASTEIDFNLSITNPSAGEQMIKSFTADVLYNNLPLGKINYLQPINILPTSYKQIQVPMVVSNFDLLKNFPGLLSTSLSGVKVDVNGYLNTDLGAIPFNKSVTLI